MLRGGVTTRVKEETVNSDMEESMCKGRFAVSHRETQTSGSKTSLRECAGLNRIFLCCQDTITLRSFHLYGLHANQVYM